ncbi:MAG: metal-dependent transcriptional regulator [Thermoguttaceae bacterium]|nr:metal-dependent transcriptional regulator [Thermoguttaceae bacterium]MDI9443747.1 metal-dependent transcriptional regulator [Planctomycetota bacterium]
MASLTVEKYVRAIWSICEQTGSQLATTGRLATVLGVSPGTVTSMLKSLGESGLAAYTPYEGVRLTDEGCRLAHEILRRHHLFESFLARVLNLSCEDVHEDAARLAHAASDRLIDRIDVFLGHPPFEPRGAPTDDSAGGTPQRDRQPRAGAAEDRAGGEAERSEENRSSAVPPPHVLPVGIRAANE